jgi:hypothetical protein
MAELTKESGEATTRCPRCDQIAELADRYCRNCGLKLLQDANEIGAYLEALLPKKIEEALGSRLKDQKVVEIETSEQIADRAMKWMKLAGFFLGIPLVLITALISFLGYKTYADIEKLEQKITEAQPRLEVSVKRAEALESTIVGTEQRFTSIQQRIDGLDSKVQINEGRQQNLEQDVKNIKDRLVFGEGKALTSDLKDMLRDVLARYIKYLETIGFTQLDQGIKVVAYSKDEPPGHPNMEKEYGVNTIYDNGTIFIHRDLLADSTIAVRAYTDHALLKAIGKGLDDALVSNEIEFAFADYFTVSFFDDPIIGKKSTKSFQVRNLEDNKRRDDRSSIVNNGEALGEALWRCRDVLGKTAMDKIVFQSWLQASPMKNERDELKALSSSLKDFARKSGGPRAVDCLVVQFKNRNIPQ